jgi:hypothetical protein
MVLLIQFLQLIVLRGETTLRGGVHNENHFVGILFQRYWLAFSVFDRELIDCFHFSYNKKYIAKIAIKKRNLPQCWFHLLIFNVKVDMTATAWFLKPFGQAIIFYEIY